MAIEALANVAKHARARHARVELCARAGELLLRVVDDGVGGADPAGGGLSGLRDRVRAVDGELRVRSARDGGMAEKTLVRRGMWLRVPDDVDDVTAAAVTNPGMAAWKTLFWEGDLTTGQTVLVLGATGTSGRIAVQLAARHGARVIAAGRNLRVLDELLAAGADGAIRVDRPHAELAAAIAAHGPGYGRTMTETVPSGWTVAR